MPRFIRFTSSATHDHTLLKDVNLPKGSIIVFDKAYVYYGVYERFSKEDVTCVKKFYWTTIINYLNNNSAKLHYII